MKVQDKEDIAQAMAKVDYTQLKYDDATGILTTDNPDIQIELGAIGKGYAIEQAKDVLKRSDASGGMVSAGSSIYVCGTKKDGSRFRVALRDPRGDENSAIGVLTLSDTTISTSGDYERYFEKDGVTYHHIIDPSTGYPADNGLISVTIVSADGTLADGLSTSLFVMGKDKATNYWKAHSDEFDMILLTDDEKLYVSEGIKDSFTSDREFEIVEK